MRFVKQGIVEQFVSISGGAMLAAHGQSCGIHSKIVLTQLAANSTSQFTQSRQDCQAHAGCVILWVSVIKNCAGHVTDIPPFLP